jgi:hypothetical protein
MPINLVMPALRLPKQIFKKTKAAQEGFQCMRDKIASKLVRYFSAIQTSNIVLESKRFWSRMFKFWSDQSTISSAGLGNCRVSGAPLQESLSCC